MAIALNDMIAAIAAKTGKTTTEVGDGIDAKSAAEGVDVTEIALNICDKLGIDMDAKATALSVPTRMQASIIPATSFTDEEVTLLKAAGRMEKDASPAEVKLAFAVMQNLGLNPLRKQIQFVRFGGKNEPMAPFINIDGLQAIASRTQEFAGEDLPVYEFDDDGTVLSASVTVYRLVRGIRCPFSAKVFFAEFAKRKGDGSLNTFWRTMPVYMLTKVARAHAIRMAFPEEAGGLYTEEEKPARED